MYVQYCTTWKKGPNLNAPVVIADIFGRVAGQVGLHDLLLVLDARAAGYVVSANIEHL